MFYTQEMFNALVSIQTKFPPHNANGKCQANTNYYTQTVWKKKHLDTNEEGDDDDDDDDDNGNCTSSGGHNTDRFFTFPSPPNHRPAENIYIFLFSSALCCSVLFGSSLRCVRASECFFLFSFLFFSFLLFPSLHFTSLRSNYFAHRKQNFLFYTYLNSFGRNTMQLYTPMHNQ